MLLGDLVSLYLAVLRGVDPTPVEAIDRLKTRAEREDSAAVGDLQNLDTALVRLGA